MDWHAEELYEEYEVTDGSGGGEFNAEFRVEREDDVVLDSTGSGGSIRW